MPNDNLRAPLPGIGIEAAAPPASGYVIRHAYDLTLIDDAPSEGPYSSWFEARTQAERLYALITDPTD